MLRAFRDGYLTKTQWPWVLLLTPQGSKRASRECGERQEPYCLRPPNDQGKLLAVNGGAEYQAINKDSSVCKCLQCSNLPLFPLTSRSLGNHLLWGRFSFKAVIPHFVKEKRQKTICFNA